MLMPTREGAVMVVFGANPSARISLALQLRKKASAQSSEHANISFGLDCFTII